MALLKRMSFALEIETKRIPKGGRVFMMVFLSSIDTQNHSIVGSLSFFGAKRRLNV